jgi:ATPase subunit of ABC transporter with duplicated ATPase domains
LEAKAREMAAEEKGEDTMVEKTPRQLQLASRPYRNFQDRVHLDLVRRDENNAIYALEAEAKARALAEATSITPMNATSHERSISQAEFLARMENDVGRRNERQHERQHFFQTGHVRTNSMVCLFFHPHRRIIELCS